MTKVKSLLDGIGNEALTEKYYDDWALNYDQTLKKWNYKAPLKAVNVMSLLKENINSNLDLACGTGMFAATLKKNYPNITVDGCDISSQSLKVAKKKKLYRKLIKQSFEKKINITKKYDSVSMIGSMTYCKKPKLLFSLILNYLKKDGIFIFTHRIDLWDKQNFDLIVNNFNKSFHLAHKSRPLNYLPQNSSFSNKIKIRLVVLKKI
jgi:predicted TPR repeat methyltransferase